MSTQNPKAPANGYLSRMDAYLVCDEVAVIVHRLHELVCHSQSHSRLAFLSSADDIFSDLLETVDQGWTAIEEIAAGLER